MSINSSHISDSIEVLNQNLIDIAQVREWASMMGYRNTKKFSRLFLRHYSVRPCKILAHTRLKSIYHDLQKEEFSNFEIACRHSMPDEKALNKFVKYHMGCCPRSLQKMPAETFARKLEKFGSKIR